MFSSNQQNGSSSISSGLGMGSGSGSGYGLGMGSGSGSGSEYSSYGRGAGGFSDFMSSNSLVAKVSFLLLAIFVFVIMLQLSISFLVWWGTPGGNVHLFDGMVQGNQQIIIPQDPSMEGSRTVMRSVNTPEGIEFTWSVWIFIEEADILTSNQYRHIFHKGNNSIDTSGSGGAIGTGANFPNNAPGLYISPNLNELTVVMNTFDVINQEVKISNIPLNKWINVMIRCKGQTLDVYINGTITRSTQLLGVPKQNYGDVIVAANGGFSGYISNLWYYNHALGTNEIQNLVKKGPNIKMTGSDAITSNTTNYLSLRWFFYGN